MKKNYREVYMYALGAFVVGGAFSAVGISMIKEIPTPNHDIVVLGFGQLMGLAFSVVTYFYGSSKSSADKTEMMNAPKPTNIDNSDGNQP